MSKLTVSLTFLMSVVCVGFLGAQPVAAFAYDKGGNSSCAPLTIDFNNSSQGDIASYVWTVNGRLFSRLESPTRTFVDTGAYQICLTIVDVEGREDTYCEGLELFGAPELALTVDREVLCAAGEVVLSLQSSVGIQRVAWDFGGGQVLEADGNGQTFLQQKHTYQSPGSYSVLATVVDVNRCEQTILERDLLLFPPLVEVDFTMSTLSGCPHSKQVIFQSSPILPSGTYRWDFGDGNSREGRSTIHNYDRFGSYNVRLSITDTISGCQYVVEKENILNYEDIQFSYSITESEDCSGRTIEFRPPTEVAMKSYSWDFGDGTTSTDSIVQHSYQEAGCYTPSFSFTTPDGCQTTVYVPECIKVNGPHNIDIWTSDDWVGCSESPGLPLFLNASSDIVGVRWEWHMGNMDTLQGKPIDYLYRTFGEYPVDLLVKYDNGCERTIPVDTAKLAPVLVNVWASTRSGCAPLQVDFRPQIQSLDSIISYKWEMDGRTYWEKEPTVLFARTGRYDIRLTVRTADGCEESLRLENYISIGEAVDIDFSADLLETCSDTSIAFSSQANGRVDKWLWQFGDSLTADVANPIHRYVDTGIFDVVLIAWQNGCPSTITKPQYIHIYPPIAKAAFEIDCNDPRLIQFTDNSLGAQTWEWDFGDGNTSTEQHPVHRYRRGGTYEVILTVVNRDYNCRDAVLTEVIMVDEEAEFELPKMKVCIGDSMRIENEAVYGARFEYTVPAGVKLIQNGPGDANPLLLFSESGAFGPFSLLQTDVNGCTTRYTINDLVRVEEVVADFTADPTAGCPGVEVSFQSLSTSSEGRPLAHAWMFGQRGARSTEENPRQTFLGEDSYDIFLEVKSDEGCKDTEEKPDMILVNVPKAGFRSQLVDCDMNIIQFQSQSQGGRLSYLWTFGDGRTSTLSQPLHNYVDAGRYEVCLEVANSSSCLDKFCAFVDVDNLRTDFEADNTYKSCPTPPLLTTFRDLSLGAVAWEWDFGDGTAFSYIADPVHAYSEVGTYTVCLTSWDKDGCSETHCKENFIRVDGPKGMLSVSNNLGCAPLAVEFVAEVSPNTSVYVDFGNGAGKEIAQSGGRDVVQYDYLYEGLYIPVLILEDASGCRVSSLGEAIEVRELNIDFQLSQADFCQGDSIVIDFDLLLADDVSRYNFEWELPGSVQGSSNLAEPKGIQYEEVGLYDVILHVYSDDCSTSLYKREAVHVHPQVLPGVELPSQACAPVEFVVQVDTTAVSMNGLEWEWDLGNGQTSQAIAPFVRYDSVGTYVTRLYTRTQEGCVAERLDTIVVNEPPEALAGQAAPICLGDAVLLGSTFVPDTNWTIQWFPVDGLSCADCPSPVAQPDKTTRYHLEVTNEHGCLAVDSVEVVIRPFVHPQIDVLPDTSVCRGRQVQLSVLSDRPVWGHQWTDSYGSLSCYDCPQPVLLLDSSAYLSVQVRSEGDCLAVDSVFVEVFEQQANVLGEDRSICAGDSLLLQLEYQVENWMGARDISCLTCPTPYLFPDSSRLYQIEVRDGDGCLISDQLQVTVLHQESISAGLGDTVCLGESFRANGSYEGQGRWIYQGRQVAGDVPDPLVSIQNDSLLILEVVNDLCMLRDTLELEVIAKADISTFEYSLCMGDSVQLEVVGRATQFSWSPLTEQSDVRQPWVKPDFSTTYQLIASDRGCLSDTAYAQVDVLPAPEGKITSVIRYREGERVGLQLSPREPNLSYRWEPADILSCTDCPAPWAYPEGTVNVRLVATNEYGCSSVHDILLEPLQFCEPEDIIVPNAFSPNNDGENDRLYVRGDMEVLSLRIYNRWGELVHQSAGDQGFWDGTYKGQELDPGVFVYFVEALCPLNGAELVKTGDVLLIR